MAGLGKPEGILHPEFSRFSIDVAQGRYSSGSIKWLCHDSPPQTGSSVRFAFVPAEKPGGRVKIEPTVVVDVQHGRGVGPPDLINSHLRTDFPVGLLIRVTVFYVKPVSWGGWPIRLFVIDTDGTVIYASPNGPWGFRPTEGSIHGDGNLFGADRAYDQMSLDSFLDRKLKKN
ncbi:MAG: hypothetical protein HKN23_17130 [Verrucomicrobiales bacterium]|nr:hypothetical protein [Verrucomicrobiales bacterium]